MSDDQRLADAVEAFHLALDADPDTEVMHCRGNPAAGDWCTTTEGRTAEIVAALLAAGWTPPVKPGRVKLYDGPIRFTEHTPTTFHPGL